MRLSRLSFTGGRPSHGSRRSSRFVNSARRLSACVAKTKRFLGGCIAEGQADGTIRDDVPAPALGAIVMGATQALALGNHAPAAATTIRRGLVTLLRPAEAPAARAPGKDKR